jgi:hypothetical protein
VTFQVFFIVLVVKFHSSNYAFLFNHPRTELGDEFDIRKFHNVVLTNGPVPLDILEDIVLQYIAEEKAG